MAYVVAFWLALSCTAAGSALHLPRRRASLGVVWHDAELRCAAFDAERDRAGEAVVERRQAALQLTGLLRKAVVVDAAQTALCVGESDDDEQNGDAMHGVLHVSTL